MWYKLTCFVLLELFLIGSLADEEENQLTVTNSDDEVLPNRIVQGVRISILDAPYQVAILRYGDLNCGGSILSNSWILTAAHCVVGESRRSITVRAGSDGFRRGGQLRSVRNMIVHGNYNEQTSNNDIAMIKLRRPLAYNNAVQPIRLPAARNAPLPRNLQVSGWGVVRENGFNPTRYLRQTTLQVASRRACKRNYRLQDVVITNKMICMYKRGSDSCQGDSGGPLVAQGTLYGIVSFGIGCARRFLPGIYTDVRKFIIWINQVQRNQ